MLPRNLQFQFSANERHTKFVTPQQLHCIRQTYDTLEFLYCTASGTFRIIIVTGSNLGVLRRSIIAGTVHLLAPGPYLPQNAGVAIHTIAESTYWSLPKEAMAPDPNGVPRHCLQFETGLVRDLWSHVHLDAFAIPQGKAEKFLFQFRGDYSYVITPLPHKFAAVLIQLKLSNLDLGMINKFSAVPDPLLTMPGVVHQRFEMHEILFNHRNYASDSEWNVVVDFRPQAPKQRIGVVI